MVIGKAYRFFTNPAARVGAIIAVAMMAFNLASTIVMTGAHLFTEPVVLNGTMMDYGVLVPLSNLLSSLTLGLILLFFAIAVEYAARIASDIGHIRSRAVRKPSGDRE